MATQCSAVILEHTGIVDAGLQVACKLNVEAGHTIAQGEAETQDKEEQLRVVPLVGKKRPCWPLRRQRGCPPSEDEARARSAAVGTP